MRAVLLVLTVLVSFGCASRGVTSSPVARSTRPVDATPDARAFEEGEASWYGDPYHGRRAASGEIFDKNKMTAAHRTLPFDTWVRVENQLNRRTVDVRINDRGPFVRGRIIDLSRGAAEELDMVRAGVVPVRLTVIRTPDRAGLPSSAPPRGGDVFYVVQLGAFQSEQNARNLARSLENKYTGIYVEPPSRGSRLYRVRIGRAVLADARYVQNLLEAEDDIEAVVQEVRGD
jgi:rare lipoprotein A